MLYILFVYLFILINEFEEVTLYVSFDTNFKENVSNYQTTANYIFMHISKGIRKKNMNYDTSKTPTGSCHYRSMI